MSECNPPPPPALESPLHYFVESFAGKASGPAEKGLRVSERPHKGHLALCGNADERAFTEGVEGVLGLALPTAPCTFVADGAIAAYWLAPGEWLLLIDSHTQTAALESRLRETVQTHFSAVDVSGGQTLINLSGPAVAEVMKKSCVYDFSAANFPAGRCVQTVFAKAGALVAKTADGSLDVIIRRSFADYLAEWLLDAGREYGCCIVRE